MKHSTKCSICTNRLLNYKSYLRCNICDGFSHNKCNYLSKNEASNIIENKDLHSNWICHPCRLDIFPLMSNADDDPLSSTSSQHTTPTISSTPHSTCNSCYKCIGIAYSICCFCDNKVHNRCNKGLMGCNKCSADIFPADTSLFNDNYNNLIFDPYDDESLFNKIGEPCEIDDDPELLGSLSKILKKCNYNTLESLKSSSPSELSVLSLNIGSLNSNFRKLKDNIENLRKFDIICLGETNIDHENLMYPSFFDLEGFHTPIFQNPARDSNRGGGLAIYVSNAKFTETSINILTDISETESPESGEFLFIEIDTGPKSKNIIIGNTYRSPAHKPDMFIEKLNSKIAALHKNNNKHILRLRNFRLIPISTGSYRFQPTKRLKNVRWKKYFDRKIPEIDS